MTAVANSAPVTLERGARDTGLDACLARLDEAIEAGRALGLDVARCESIRLEARERLGFTADAYVVALVGGTGVGKSTILNALAGATVSAAGVRRPTTAQPVAWISADAHSAVAPLLERLGVGASREHHEDALRDVAILDLPDIDSLASEHRARVEELLPRVDAVVWVTDPEKYHDAVLHDAFLRGWLPRLDRQLVVVNKSDRLTAADAERVRRDLEADLGPRRIPGIRHPPAVVLTAAASGPPGVAELHRWLADETAAKRVVMARLGAAARASVEDVGRLAGADPDDAARPFVGAGARDEATRATIAETLRLIDLDGAERQAVAATRARARARGTGPIGRVTSAIYKGSGREAHVADPARFLARWHERGSLARAIEPLRLAIADAIPHAPAATRPALAAAAEPSVLTARIERTVDRIIASRGGLPPPSRRLWSVLGLLQTLNLVLLVFSVAWLILWVVARPPVDSVAIPIIGLLPMPFALLCLGLLLGFVLARSISIHAGWVGRGWARGLGNDLAGAIDEAIGRDAFAALDALETARTTLWRMSREMRASCPGG